MRRKLTITAVSALALLGATAAATAPAHAGPSAPVKAGKDDCGNFNVWIKGDPIIYYLHCGPDWD